jgi:hypothetical protein
LGAVVKQEYIEQDYIPRGHWDHWKGLAEASRLLLETQSESVVDKDIKDIKESV